MSEHGALSIQRQRRSQGFSLLEVMLAIGVLSVGVMSLAMLIPFATENDYRSRIDTTATFVAMRQMEQMLAQPTTVVSFTDASDNPALNPPVVVNLIDSDVTDTVGTGAALDPNGNINFSQAPGAVPPGYRRSYTIAPSGGNTVKVNGGTYEVRWNIYENSSGIKTIVVAAQTTAPLPGTTPFPANVRAVQMR